MFFSEIYQPGVADFDPSGKFGYEAILRILENTASRHSDSSGDDIIEESRNGITWVRHTASNGTVNLFTKALPE